MRNSDTWQPSKFVFRKGQLRASEDSNEVGVYSRLMANTVARTYDVYIRDHCRGRLVDLGCGQVPLYGAYRNYIDENICVDWNKSSHGSLYLDCECDLTQILPFKDEIFDTIILSDVLEHIPLPFSLWAEMSRILKVNGKLILNVPFYYGLHETPYDYFRYTEYALRRFAETTDLIVLLIESIGGSPEIFADLMAKHLIKAPILGRSLSNAIQKLTFGVSNTNMGKKISKKTGEFFPFGYFLIAQKQVSSN